MNFFEDFLELGHNRPGTPFVPSGIVLHSTDTPGATAAQIRNAFDSHPKDQASAHACVDWIRAVTMIPWQPGKAEIAWHAGPTANHRFLGIEWCETGDPALFAQCYANYVAAVRAILDLHHWPADDAHVWSHERISSTFRETTHVDPTPYLTKHGKTWEQLMHDINEAPSVPPTFVLADPATDAAPVFAGAAGPQVVEIQNLLKAKGLYAGAVDGIFGPETRAALLTFQRSCNLVADGIAGPETLARLRA
jgi:N-acetylmuramoyl-L-alanine amidase CwlA